MSIRYVHDLYPRTNPRDGALVRRLAKLNEAQFEAVRNGTGSGLVKMRGIGADAAAIDPRGLQLVRVSQINTDIVNGLTLSGFDEQVVHGYWLEQGDFEALDRMRLRKLSFGGAGMLAYLEREHHWSHSYLSEINPAFGTMDPFDGIFRWWNQGDWAGGDFLGAILWRGMSEGLAHRIGATYTHRHATPEEFGQTFTDAHDDDKLATAIPYLVLDFDQFVDSNGNAWVVPSGELESPVGETLYTFATRLMAAGLYIELDPVTFALRAWEVANHGRNRTGLAWGANVVRFNPPPPPSTAISAGNILGDLKRAVRPLIRATSLLTGGRDIYGLATQAGDVPWHRFHADDAGEVAALSAVATRQLGARNDAGDTVQVPAKTGNDPVNGYYLPFVHAQLDDLVTLHSGAETWDWAEAAYPLAKIAVKSLRAGAPSVIYHLGASYHATGDRRFDGGAGVGRHTHPPNPQLCPSTDLFRGLGTGSLKSSGDEVSFGRELAVDGSDALASVWSGVPTDAGVANMWWAADIGSTQLVDAFRLRTSTEDVPGDSPQNIATEARLYGTNDAAVWAALTHGSGMMASDPADNGWALITTHTSTLVDPSESGHVGFTPAPYRYWLWKAISGGTSEWDINTLELWSSVAADGRASRCGHGHGAHEIAYAGAATGSTAATVQERLDELDAALEAAISDLESPAVVSHGLMGVTETFDATVGHDHQGTQDANLSVTLTGATGGEAAWMTLVLAQDGSGGRTLTLPGSVVNAATIEAAWDTTASAVNVLSLFSYDGGATWYGFLAGSGVAAEPAFRWVPVSIDPLGDEAWEILFDDDGSVVMMEVYD